MLLQESGVVALDSFVVSLLVCGVAGLGFFGEELLVLLEDVPMLGLDWLGLADAEPPHNLLLFFLL